MQARVYYSLFILISLMFFLTSCVSKQKNTLFTQLPSSASGIHFSNDI